MSTDVADIAANAAVDQPNAPSTAPAAEGGPNISEATPPAAVPADPSTVNDTLGEVELLRLENARLKLDLIAHVEHKARTAEIVAEIDAAETLYETSKAEAKRHKEARDGAKASLRALVAGDVNVRIDFSAPKAEEAIDAAIKAPPVSKRRDARQVSATYAVSQFALTRDDLEKADVSKVRPLEPTMDKRKVDATWAGPMPFVVLEQECFDDGSGAFLCWPLIDAESWDVNFASKYAPAIRDVIDESPDVVARRKTGGELCGVTVKVAGQRRKRFVIGPNDLAARFLYGTTGGAVEATCVAASLLPASLPAEKTTEVLAFPTSQIGDRLEARLREYSATSAGHHEGLLMSLAADLKISEAEVAAAARADSFRFDLFTDKAGSESREIVRLLTDASPATVLPETKPPFDDEPETLAVDDETVADSMT